MMRVDACSALPISAVEIPSALRESPTTMRRTWTSTDAAFRDNTLPLTLKPFAGSLRSKHQFAPRGGIHNLLHPGLAEDKCFLVLNKDNGDLGDT